MTELNGYIHTYTLQCFSDDPEKSNIESFYQEKYHLKV